MELGLFEQVGETLRSLADPDHGELHFRAHRRGVKVWFGDDGDRNREHYESQVLARRHVDGSDGMTVETGFHAENREIERNDEIIARIDKAQKKWRKVLSADASTGPFYGRPEDWRRFSEVWIEPDLDDPELAFELAATLADYINIVEPLRRA